VSGWMDHLIIAPILLPLAAGALMLLFDERRRRLKQSLSLLTTVALVVIAWTLLYDVANPDAGSSSTPRVYLLGNWASSVGIVLVVDRLSALMLTITSILGLTSLLYALARWDRSGPRFHALFLFLLMGINGAFLTGDIFNLFVFFEVLLAASYGLALHGAGVARTKASLHYIAFNVATSLLFLIGVALIYSVTGTLNMAALTARVAELPADELVLLQGGAAILGIAFLVKAGLWPLSFWLPGTYGAAPAPVAAVFPILTKVGIYVVLRLTSLVFGDVAGSAAGFADDWLVYAGMVTIVFGTLAVLSSQTLTKVAGYYLLISSGTLLAAIGVASLAVTAGALFYLLASTLAVSAFYLIIEPVERNAREEDAAPLTEPVFDDEYVGALPEEEETEIGVAIPATIALLGGGFIFCTLLLSGMPPLPGFLAKFAIIHGLVRVEGDLSVPEWALIGLIITSGLVTLVTMTRAGIDLLWAPADQTPTRVAIFEAVPIGLLLGITAALSIWAGPVMRYMESTAHVLNQPQLYIDAVRMAPRAGGGDQSP
jgi:multicomponent K+:H+ antiporter subunit D